MAARRNTSFSLDELTPAKRGQARAQAVEEDDPIVAQTIRLPESFWQRVRLLALANRTTSISEIRKALEAHFVRELPEARARLTAIKP